MATELTAEYTISTDRTRLDLDSIHAFLSTEAYWSPGVERTTVERAIDGSLPFGIYRGDEQVGFARVVTDGATFAWIADVYVLAAHRGHGLGKRLVTEILGHPDLQNLRRWLLATADAHGLYGQFGFTPVDGSDRFMSRPGGGASAIED
jgi:GNAT superfamily N-acetyltransferase